MSRATVTIPWFARFAIASHRASPANQSGFTLLPVVLAMVLIATIAFALNNRSTLDVDITAAQTEAQRAGLVTQAGLQHALWRAQHSACGGNLTLPSTPFGSDSYQAAVTSSAATTTSTVSVDQDAWLKESDPTNNYGNDDKLSVKAASGDNRRALYRFNLSTIPAGTQLSSATAWFYVEENDANSAVVVHEITAAWAEATVTWATAASQFSSPVIASIPVQAAKDVWIQLNLTSLVQSWVNGSPNNGIMLIATSNEVKSKYTSREWATASERPYLEVVTSSGATSPVTISATGTLLNGVNRTLKRVDTPVFQVPSSPVRQPGVELQDAWTWDGAHKDKNFGVSPILSVANAGKKRTSLIRFDMAALPPGARIAGAQLGLYLEKAKSLTNGVLDLHRVSRAWLEGTKDDANPGGNGGVTYDSYDGSNSWTSGGGDYDPQPIDSITIATFSSGWYSWDVTGLLQAWLSGEANNGVLLRASGGNVDKVDFASSDGPLAEHHPRLTLKLVCECGIVCQIPQGSGNVLLIVDNDQNLTPVEGVLQSTFESWGYLVTALSDDSSQALFDTNLANHDVVYVSATAASTAVANKLTAAAIGVVNALGSLNDELGIASGTTTAVGRAVTIIDNSHYITALFPSGTLPIYAAAMEGQAVSGAAAADLQTLANWGSAGSLAVLETGAALGGSHTSETAKGRRVSLPLGGSTNSNFNWNYLNSNGRLMVQRALQWGTGNTVY